jgi:hypothetical protein
METIIESKRTYSVEESVNGNISNYRIKLTEIMDKASDSETIYAMQERIDDILDLKLKKAMFFQPNRDDNDSKGIITRIR